MPLKNNPTNNLSQEQVSDKAKNNFQSQFKKLSVDLGVEIADGLSMTECIYILTNNINKLASTNTNNPVLTIAIQASFKHLGYNQIKSVDGIYGKKETEQVARLFQEDVGTLTVDGDFGPLSIKALIQRLKGLDNTQKIVKSNAHHLENNEQIDFAKMIQDAIIHQGLTSEESTKILKNVKKSGGSIDYAETVITQMVNSGKLIDYDKTRDHVLATNQYKTKYLNKKLRQQIKISNYKKRVENINIKPTEFHVNTGYAKYLKKLENNSAKYEQAKRVAEKFPKIVQSSLMPILAKHLDSNPNFDLKTPLLMQDIVSQKAYMYLPNGKSRIIRSISGAGGVSNLNNSHATPLGTSILKLHHSGSKYNKKSLIASGQDTAKSVNYYQKSRKEARGISPDEFSNRGSTKRGILLHVADRGRKTTWGCTAIMKKDLTDFMKAVAKNGNKGALETFAA